MNSFDARSTLSVGGRDHEIFRLDALQAKYDVARLPYALKVLLENLLRNENGQTVKAEDVEALARWVATDEPSREIAYTPARVLLQDFTGVPAVVDLAAMRDAMNDLGGDPSRINPLQPVELVIDHSVQVDEFGTRFAFLRNAEREFERNQERYAFLRWGQQAFDNFKVVPPDTGIVHQVNLEYLARVVFAHESGGTLQAYPDTLVGTDSHTTMVNGLGVLGWGVGGIEAEAAMLGQPVSMLIPQVIGFKLEGELPEGATATDLVLVVTQMLREKGVVGKFVEFYGKGLAGLSLADRATISNMAPEQGATCVMFPIDVVTLDYLRFTGRSEEHVALVEAYAREQRLFHGADSEEAVYTDTLQLDLADVEPSLAGPRRPQDRVPLRDAKEAFQRELGAIAGDGTRAPGGKPNGDSLARFAEEGGHTAVGVQEQAPGTAVAVQTESDSFDVDHGSVVIAAITSCTNTSNPTVMVSAGLLAKKAVERGLRRRPWVKTSLAPGSKVVTEYLDRAGLTGPLEELGFNLVGYGCTTCIGNSGPLPVEISKAIEDGDLAAVSVLSGNRNFEGRIHSEVKMNYLASPPLVVAYALAGRMSIDLVNDPLGEDESGEPVYLRDLWPSQQEVQETIATAVQSDMFSKSYADVYAGDERWNGLQIPAGDLYDWGESTYVLRPPYFEGMGPEPQPVEAITGARVLALLGDSVTTDHISPAGAIKLDSPAGRYLVDHGIERKDFNSYGSRRGNHEVMVRGTFANIRLRNTLVPGAEGTWTVHFPSGEQMSIYDAAMRYMDEGVPLVVLAGKEYGSGSSRDWAAKGPKLLGVRAVIAESYERIHRSNLVGMGILPLQFAAGESAESLGLTGEETFDVHDVGADARETEVTARSPEGGEKTFRATVRIDTPQEWLYYAHGGILQYVLRQLLRTPAQG
jgi:aconitate hydratase A / 2-methylisocitrate dehydratase